MTVSKLTLTLCTVVATVAVACSVQAASVTWGSIAQMSGAADINTNGSLFQALNFGGGSTVALQTVNTVPFAPAAVDSNTATQTWGNVGIDATPSTWVQFLTQIGSTATTGDADFDAMLEHAMFDPVNPHEGNDLTISNLVAGNTYEIQIFSNDSRNIPAIFGRTTTLDGSVTLPQNGGSATLGGMITGSVVADGAPLVIRVDSLESSYLLNAMQIRLTEVGIPEPTTLALGVHVAFGLDSNSSPSFLAVYSICFSKG